MEKRLSTWRARERRRWLVQSLRTHLLPALVNQNFYLAPHVTRGPVDREFLLMLPLGRLVRRRAQGEVDLLEIEFAPYQVAAFRIVAGVAPAGGLMTFSGHWAAEDLYAGWLDECFVTHARPALRWVFGALGMEELGGWFSVWHWPLRSPTQSDYEELAHRTVDLVPELDSALLDGRLGPHIRRVVARHPRPNRAQH